MTNGTKLVAGDLQTQNRETELPQNGLHILPRPGTDAKPCAYCLWLRCVQSHKIGIEKLDTGKVEAERNRGKGRHCSSGDADAIGGGVGKRENGTVEVPYLNICFACFGVGTVVDTE